MTGIRHGILIPALLTGILCPSSMGWSRAKAEPDLYGRFFTPIAVISPANFNASFIGQAARQEEIRRLCDDLGRQYRKYKWSESACAGLKWQAELKSGGGRPLLFLEFGKGDDVTLILGGVHPDELTPIPIAFRIASWLARNEASLQPGVRVVVAPLVNPDGFLREVPTRTNTNGVDVNRNFFTFDWYEKAKALWVNRRNRTASHFPGYVPNSEIETLFQIQLIDQFKPGKIMSIHAPLGFLDYDGPGDGMPDNLTPTQVKARQLVQAVAEKSRNYRIVDYTFFPGSLGNFAGNERKIPTVTLEFETTDPAKVDTYWDQFLPGISHLIHYPFKPDHESMNEDGADASTFSPRYLPPAGQVREPNPLRPG